MPKKVKGSSKPAKKFQLEEKVSDEKQAELLQTLEDRFKNNMHRHKGLKWDVVLERLKKHPKKIVILNAMEQTGGEPDVVAHNKKTGEFVFYDCVAESPKGRRSVCYDQQALDARKEHKPVDSAVNMAKEMGVELLTEEQYRELQKLGEFDLKTSSWVRTPEEIRKHGGAIFCDRRYEHVFTYHNGAESYYSSRGFRGLVRV